MSLSKVKAGSTMFYRAVILVFIVGYIFFFTSKFWINDGGGRVKPTKLFSAISVGDKDITVFRWNYSKKQKLMEIEIEIDNKSPQIKTDAYRFSAYEVQNGLLKTKNIYETDKYLVVHVLNVPENWSEMSVRMFENDKSDALTKLYANKDSVGVVESIDTLSEREYESRHIDDIEEYYKKVIEDTNTDIQTAKDEITAEEIAIADITAEMEFMTEKEKETANTRINSIRQAKESNIKKIEDYKAKIEEYQTKIQLAERKKASIQSGGN